MGARSYIPQLGRFLQADPVPGGSANAYAYTFGDPVNSSDLSGALTYGFSSWLKELNSQQDQEVVARETAREALEREEAERRVREAEEAAAAAAAAAAGPAGAEEPLGGYAGWSCEYASETGQEAEGCGGGGGCSGLNACAASTAGAWVCVIDGAVVGVGVALTIPSAGFSDFVSAVASTALGIATEQACNFSPVHNIEVSGLPRSSGCFDVLTISKRTHKRDHRTEECYA